jgi:hypothetical protein
METANIVLEPTAMIWRNSQSLVRRRLSVSV